MFPWLRFIRAGLTSIGKPRVGPLDVTRVRMRVWPNDLDLNLHVNNGRYLSLADVGRLEVANAAPDPNPLTGRLSINCCFDPQP